MSTTVEASKVRKGQVVVINGAPRLVTKRKKLNSKLVVVHYEHPGYPRERVLAWKIQLKLSDRLEIYEGLQCKLCEKLYMPWRSLHDGFCGYGCSSAHTSITR